MMLHVYHHKRPTFTVSEEPLHLEDYMLVAVIETIVQETHDALDRAFWLTNHTDSFWWKKEKEGILCHQPNARSTSVGDLVEIENTGMFYCMP